MKPPEYQRVYTPTEVAQILRVSEETIRREIRRDQLRALQVERQYHITPADLVAWLGKARYVGRGESQEIRPGL